MHISIETLSRHSVVHLALDCSLDLEALTLVETLYFSVVSLLVVDDLYFLPQLLARCPFLQLTDVFLLELTVLLL